jgi:hypothetical protein
MCVCAQNNVAAAESDEAEELLSDAPPWCYSEAGDIKKCSPIADTAIRAGIYELQEWIRPGRYYCQSRMFRDLVLEDGSVGEAECRANISARNMTCNNEVCAQCTSQCTYRSAKAAAGVVKCTVARDQLGFTHCLQISDAGQLARASHGAIRGDNYIAVHNASNTMINHTPQPSTPSPWPHTFQYLDRRRAWPRRRHTLFTREIFACAGAGAPRRARLPHLPQQSQGLRAARFGIMPKGG